MKNSGEYIRKLTVVQYVVGVVLVISVVLGTYEIITGQRGVRELANKEMATQEEVVSIQSDITELQKEGVPYSDPFITDRVDVEDMTYLGRIQIPKIKVDESIVLGTSPEKLKRGIGLMEGSDIPLGQEGQSTILAGHRGYMWRSRFFWGLDKLTIGDTINIKTSEDTYEYKVIKTSELAYDQVEEVLIQEDKTLLALVTSNKLWDKGNRLLVEAELVGKEDI